MKKSGHHEGSNPLSGSYPHGNYLKGGPTKASICVPSSQGHYAIHPEKASASHGAAKMQSFHDLRGARIHPTKQGCAGGCK